MALEKHFIIKNTDKKNLKILHLIKDTGFDTWLTSQAKPVQNWVQTNSFKAKKGNVLIIPNKDGLSEDALCIVGESKNLYALSSAATKLQGQYQLNYKDIDDKTLFDLCVGWALGQYNFDRYKPSKETSKEQESAKLLIPSNISPQAIDAVVSSVTLVRDLVNTPPNDMLPKDLETAAKNLADTHKADLKITHDKDLVKNNFHAIYAVGQGSDNRPSLIDMTWGQKNHPKVTLVGKGVCFDTGGLNIKTGNSMGLMKKDMGGAAQVLGLAKLIMEMKLPIRLRVLIGAVENSISGNSFRPSDIIKTKKGLTVEITNTDAEGRLVLCDCLAEACAEKPELIVDFATLTGAARVALGPEIPPVYSNNQKVVDEIVQCSEEEEDQLWQLPLWKGYNSYMDSSVADLVNSSANSFAGSITAALFLQNFVEDTIPWVHIDCYAWNASSKPGRPLGGEAQGMRAVFAYLEKRYG